MSALPELETERLRLRQWRDDDLDAYAALCADPDVMRHLRGPMTRDAAAEQIQAFRQHWDTHGYGLWCTTRKDDDTCIGFIGLAIPTFLPEVMPAVEIGWRLARDAWGQGLATEGACATVDVVFGPLGLDRIVSITIPENRSSWNVMQKLGMTLERTTIHPERHVDVVVYELPRPVMERVTEPELMVDDDQAQAYSDADFAQAHQDAVTRFGAAFPDFRGGRVLDLACGPADVTVRFARAYPTATIVGVEGSAAMLALGVQRVAREGVRDRVSFAHLVLPDPDLATLGAFDAVVCTSSMHHFHDPAVLWNAIRDTAAPGACVFVRDLMRPESKAAAQAIVDEHSDEPDVLRTDYFNSLCAAFTPDEVREQLTAAGFAAFVVEPVTDRHLVVHGHAP